MTFQELQDKVQKIKNIDHYLINLKEMKDKNGCLRLQKKLTSGLDPLVDLTLLG